MRCWEGRAWISSQATGPSGTLGVQGREAAPHLHVQVAHRHDGLLPGRPGSEARWIRGGRWKRPSGSPGMPRRGLSGVCRANTGLVFGKPDPTPSQVHPIVKSQLLSVHRLHSRASPEHGAVHSRAGTLLSRGVSWPHHWPPRSLVNGSVFPTGNLLN